MYLNELHQGGIRAILDYDNSVFDNMTLPTGVDLADVVDHIIYKFGDAPLFSPDPSVIKFYIGRWSKRRLPLWEKFKAAIEIEYNPLENYDRTEETTDYFTHGHKVVTGDDFTHGHKVVTDDDLTHGLTTETKISADNASTYQPDGQAINSGTDERDIEETHSGKDERDIEETHSGQDKRDYDSRIHGNIGVTTSQQMLQSELDIIPKLDLIDFIADDWHSEFNMMVYY